MATMLLESNYKSLIVIAIGPLLAVGMWKQRTVVGGPGRRGASKNRTEPKARLLLKGRGPGVLKEWNRKISQKLREELGAV